MNRYIRILALSNLVILAVFPAALLAEPEVYGKLDLGLQNVDDESEPDDFWEVKNHASRFGVKGKADTDYEGLNIIYKLEWEVDVTDNANSSDDHIKARNQFIGLQGGFGQFIIGRHDTPLKTAQGKIDQFNDMDADIKVIMGGAENRESNIYQYTSPEIAGGVTVTLMAIPGEDPAGENNGLSDGTSFSVNYENESLYVAMAMDSDVEGDDTDASRLAGMWKFGDFGVGGLWQTSDFGMGEDEEVMIASAYYKIGNNKLKAQFGSADNYEGMPDTDAELMAVGYDIGLSKNSKLGFYYFSREGGDDLGSDQSRDVIGTQFVHGF
ncbi:MAG TPA: porin [Gammaproteobacteria bacterium]